MDDGREGKQKVTRTLMVTSLLICAALFLFMVYSGLSGMKEGGGKYFHFGFTREIPVRPVLSAAQRADSAPARVELSEPELVQEQPAFVAAGEARAGDGAELAQAPSRESAAASDAVTPALEKPYTAEQYAAPAAPGGSQAGTATSAAGSVQVQSGVYKRPPGAKAGLPPRAGVNSTEGPAKEWKDANLSIDGILGSAGIVRKADSVVGSTGAEGDGPMFQPGRVLALGGRTGQGSVAMDAGMGAFRTGYDLKAQGLSASLGPEAAGPKIPAGKAPALPSGHVAYIIEAARAEGIDPALLAATAARESNFRPKAYRAEPHLKQVQWSAAPGQTKQSYYDGSIGPTQVLRSNFIAQGITSDSQAYDLRNNYRVSARIIKSNLNYFPGNTWKAVAAYNVGKYGAKLGRIPANNYTDTIISWRADYNRALAPYK